MALQNETIDALLALSVHGPRSAAIKDSLRELYGRFAKYDLPIDEVRHLIDESLGDRTLTERLEEIRQG